MTCQACANLDTLIDGKRVACPFCGSEPRVISADHIDYVSRVRASTIIERNKDKTNGKS